MSELTIIGGKQLFGQVRASGAKNSVLPILAATIINGGENVIHNCPDISDVHSAIKILRHLGCYVKVEGGTIIVNSAGFCRYDVPDDLMREMRSSVIFLGPILARCGKAKMTAPGGCEIGLRPIDLHLDALRKMGVNISENCGEISCECENPVGCEINLAMPSVGATENIMLFATSCKGETRIINAAREPEIRDLQNFIEKAGAKIRGAGCRDIIIEGSETKTDAHHSVIPDRIEAATYLCACAAAGGEITVTDVEPCHFSAVTAILRGAGCLITADKASVHINAPKTMTSVPSVRTSPYPGFPTDAQSPVMAAMCVASGTTVFMENIFDNRYRHCAELARMGAKIHVEGKVAVVTGVPSLSAANLKATDLRGGAALVVAALAANGKSVISHIEHIERGYEDIALSFSSLGANISKS